MSSILDALERAEQERNARGGGAAPQHEPLSRPRSLWQRPGVWLFGVGLLLFNLLVWWLMLDTGEAPQIAGVEPEGAHFAAPTSPLTEAPLLAETNSPPVVQPATSTPAAAKAQPAAKQSAVIPPTTTLAAREKTASITQPVAPVDPVQVAPVTADRVTVPPLLEAVARPAPTPTKTPISAVAKAQPVAKQPSIPQPASRVEAKEKTASVTQPIVPVNPVKVVPTKPDLASVPPLLEAAARPAPPIPAVAKAQPAVKQPAVPQPTTSVASTDKVAPVAEVTEPIKPLAKHPALEQEPVAEAPKVRLPQEGTVLEDPAAEPEVAQAPAEVEVEAAVVEEERIPEIWELPEAVQKKLKNLKINIHVYNEVPAQRFVIIEMRRYREGDPLARAGLKLERITREGVVIDYGKGLVKI